MRVGIGIMCKPPRPGLSKTRLAADLGSDPAARLAAAFLRDVVAAVVAAREHAAVDVFAFVRPASAAIELAPFFPRDVPLIGQAGDELGATMRHAIEQMLAHCPGGAMVIGTDVPQVPIEALAAAVEALRTRRPAAVLGPSTDGGYYLIGMTGSSLGFLLDPLPWSTSEVCRLTELRAREAGVPLTFIDRLSDVDDGDSLRRLVTELADRPENVARHTRAVLDSLGALPPHLSR